MTSCTGFPVTLPYSLRRWSATVTATMDHNYTKDMMIGLAVGFMILPMVFVCLRVWAKVLAKRLALDDYLTMASLVSNRLHDRFEIDA
jgi:hypothetical protein